MSTDEIRTRFTQSSRRTKGVVVALSAATVLAAVLIGCGIGETTTSTDPGPTIMDTLVSASTAPTSTTVVEATTVPLVLDAATAPTVIALDPPAVPETIAMPVESNEVPDTSPAAPIAEAETAAQPPATLAVVTDDIRTVAGSYQVAPLVRQRTPLHVDTTTATPPSDVTVAFTTEGTGGVIAGSGSTVLFSFTMRSWRTGEVYDGSAPDAPITATLGTGELAAALDSALVGVSAGSELFVTYPIGVEGLPGFVPDDDAYYLIVTVEDVA